MTEAPPSKLPTGAKGLALARQRTAHLKRGDGKPLQLFDSIEARREQQRIADRLPPVRQTEPQG